MTDDFSGASPQPWTICENGEIIGADHESVCMVLLGARGRTNAALIVAAVNAYRPQPEPPADDVERVARAIWETMALEHHLADEWDEFGSSAKEEWLCAARAARAAMPDVEALRAERDALRQALSELASAAADFESDLSEYCDGHPRDKLRGALARIREITGGK